jgi:thiamine biosynthesis lipoprotein
VCSRFREDSELFSVNRSHETELAVSPLLQGVLKEASWAREATGGLVDVGVGSVVASWGYDRTFREVTDRSRRPTGLVAPAWSLDGNILRRSPTTRLDLGGIGKGWTADRAVEMEMAGVVSAGGDVRSDDEATVVSAEDPWGETIAKVHVGVGALATSSVGRRRWHVEGREVSHVIDPRTLAPVESPVLSSTVIGETAVDAEAGAKAVMLHGEDGLAWAEATDWIRSALVVWHDGSVYGTTGLELR